MALRLLPRIAVTTRSVVAVQRSLHSSAVVTSKDPQLGDYPDLPWKSRQRRKWSAKYFDPQEKRNFGESLHEQDDLLSVWAPDVHNVNAYFALKDFALAALAIATFASIVYVTKPASPALPRTYPREGLAVELGNTGVTALPEAYFDAKEDQGEQEEKE